MATGVAGFVVLLLSGIWWLSGVRAKELDEAHHMTVPVMTQLVLSQQFVLKSDFTKFVNEVKEGQIRIEFLLERYIDEQAGTMGPTRPTTKHNRVKGG